MSKIEKALERAKQARKEIPRAPQASGLVLSAEPSDKEMPGVAPMRGEMVYTQTKVFALDEKHLERHRVGSFGDDPQVTDCYNILRTQVLQRTRAKGHNTLMITSVADGDGKSVTAINLALSIASEVKQTVLLVDTDLRQPKIHSYLGFESDKGLTDYLQNNVPIPELLVNPGLDNMVVLPAGKPLFRSADILGSPKMEQLVVEMKRRYPERYVIFDCPPLLAVPDALVFSSYVDGVILVVEAGKTPRDHVRRAVDMLQDKNIVGLVMNKSQQGPGGYYY